MNELKTIPELIEEDIEAMRKALEDMPTLNEIYREIDDEMKLTGKRFNDC
jgi:uncharacterized pyridoxamine 5'-phosphate oxidase family protein